jgi:hypothetical protein
MYLDYLVFTKLYLGNLYQIGMGERSKIIKSLSFFFLTKIGTGYSNCTLKSMPSILLTSVTLFKTHHFLYIKILIFLNLILKIKSII